MGVVDIEVMEMIAEDLNTIIHEADRQAKEPGANHSLILGGLLVNLLVLLKNMREQLR